MYRTAAGSAQTDVIDPKRGKRSQPGSCELPASTVFEGLILVDRNYRMAAFDSGAGAILGELNERNGISMANLHVPREILNLLKMQAEDPDAAEEAYHHLNIGEREYRCRVLVINQCQDGGPPMLGVLIRRELSVMDSVMQAAADYHLTDREQEALIGVTMGLTSKELAQRMDISPNTVKAFLRLVMIKMGAPTRAAIVGKLLNQNSRMRKGLTKGPNGI